MNIDQTEIRLFRGLQGLHDLELIWHCLEREIAGLRFIHHYGWYKSYLENMSPAAAGVVFVLMSNAGKPVALFPLRHGVIRRFGLTLRSWEILWPNDMGVCDFVFARSEANQACLAKLIAFLRKEKEFAWDVLHLPDILEDSCARYALPATPWPLMQVHKHHHSKSIPCDSDYESVMNRLSGDFRRNLRRQKKKLMELVPIDIRFNAQDAGQPPNFGQIVTWANATCAVTRATSTPSATAVAWIVGALALRLYTAAERPWLRLVGTVVVTVTLGGLLRHFTPGHSMFSAFNLVLLHRRLGDVFHAHTTHRASDGTACRVQRRCGIEERLEVGALIEHTLQGAVGEACQPTHHLA